MNASQFNDSIASFQTNLTVEECAAVIADIARKGKDEFTAKLNGEHHRVTTHILLIITLVGFVTNTLNIIVLRKTTLSSSMNVFLLTLSVTDTLLLFSYFGHLVHYYTGQGLIPHSNWVVYFLLVWYFLSAALAMSNWLAAAIGVWRGLVITWPLKCQEMCTLQRAKIISVAIVILSILSQIPIFFSVTYVVKDICGQNIYKLTKFELNSLLLAMLHIRSFIPLLVIIAATLWIIVAFYFIRKHKKRTVKNEKHARAKTRITLMLIVLLCFHLLSSFRRSIGFLNINASGGQKESFFTFPKSLLVDQIFMLMNGSINFFIYYALSEDFRKTFKQTVLRRAYVGANQNNQSSTAISDQTTVPKDSMECQTFCQSVL